MALSGIYFVYGLCVMFYFMMTWFFLRKNKDLLSRLVATLMLVVGLQCLKDLFFMASPDGASHYRWMVMTSIDMVAVPLYAFILMELCRPGTLSVRTMVAHEVPFVVLPVLFAVTRDMAFWCGRPFTAYGMQYGQP